EKSTKTHPWKSTTGGPFSHPNTSLCISGQEDLSHRGHYHRLFAPLWPSCLGISHNCRYTTDTETLGSQSRKPGHHDFLLQLRFGPATCVRPHDLELIPGVEILCHSFSHTLRHRLDLESVYSHILPGSGSPEVTTLHAEGGASVDYIFYTPRQGLKLVGALSLLSEDVLWSLKGLPNDIFPSDHLSLVAKFQMELNVV
uniref:Endonuclease/exonuclease/phosphatase domain-containing protein n=1 Tax=Mola mola TaxID=94237 RepID=A0A3Q3VMF2_MOLML